MTNRVILGALPGGGYGLRVSRPGHDVTNTGLTGQQLAFDSRWPSTARVFTSGTVTLAAAFPVAYQAISFGTTFASVPPVSVMFRDTSGSNWRTVDGRLHEGWEPTGGYTFELVRLYTDRIELMHPTFGSSREYCYIVMRPV